MTYAETIEFLYSKLPAFQKIGSKALKPKMTNIIELCERLDNPQKSFKTIHVAGTNGKGSSSHLLASVLQQSGYKVGLYTSPHLRDFRERFKINGLDVSESYVIDFVEKIKPLLEEIKPSFFEMTVALAFSYFAVEKVDIAVIEVGLGGRYDSTNVILPEVCLITNIGFDHQDILGDTLAKIAFEKAGIIKENTPVIISEYHPETKDVFIKEAELKNANIQFVSQELSVQSIDMQPDSLKFSLSLNSTKEVFNIDSGLIGEYQIHNIQGVILTVLELQKQGWEITKNDILVGVKCVIQNTNLKGRWQSLNSKPLVICDTGHNEHAIAITSKRILAQNAREKVFILGFVKDKDSKAILSYFPRNAKYILCTFDSFRSLNVSELETLSQENNLNAAIFEDVNEALESALKNASAEDFIFIGGSTYLVAELKKL
ncbi:bifunctional folylpolyglutamate synthase/dihydrofolate synthase [Lacihabitans lacunae]|uniref:Dihydrofolate synthase/folylpolyglutamate synthase n=1 Tax=Lacihabitans lacunae TaxID=1028214 RepID=A0ABV7YV23_9BACT